MRSRELGSVQIIIIGIAALLIVGVIGFLFWQNVINKKPTAAVNNYAECIKSAGSVQQTSYPEVCVTSDGKRFTNPNQKVADSDKPATKSFCAPIEKLCFDYPADWTVKQDKVNVDNDQVAERITVDDETGRVWLLLLTGMSGLGGACGGEDDGSYAKILQTHTTAVKGSYLVNEAAKDYTSDTAYAASWVAYNGTTKSWLASMALSNSKTVQNIGKIDRCAVAFNYFSGKNAPWSSSASEPGAMEFRLAYADAGSEETYNNETDAVAFLNGSNAKKAFAVLQSARYE